MAKKTWKLVTWLFAGVIMSGMAVSTALAQPVQGKDTAVVTPSLRLSPTHKSSPYRRINAPDSAKTYYQSVWGIDNLLVRQTASGNLIRFSYRVTDSVRAKQLVDKSATPYLIGLRSRAVLQVPVMDKVGPLRQATAPKSGQELWVMFSNKRNLVRAGDRVNVVIGSFHADGLLVE